ncbi:PEP/pyruvate-binding domain-containing protein [Mycobacteroides stephanolepidis]|nr:PEP/pyruvate-binding domain-containing protein [[Mycobacterium] stephanolepidis]
MPLGSSDFRVELAGAKAATLHELAVCGFDVPPGFVIPADTVLEQVEDTDLARWVDALGGFPVAVRSSGVFEDLDDASFAGQYESYLDVTDIACLRARIIDCRNSIASERVRAYLSDRALDPQQAAVAVLVQSLVNARTAGVGFTIDPISGIEEHGLIECCRGLGEALVSGRVTPTRLTIRLDNGTVVERVEGSEAAEISLSEAAEIARLMLRVQAFRHRPQDIEWAIDTAGKLWLLQSRAITTIIWRTDIEQFSDADLRDGGVSARVCTPLMFSLYDNAFQSSMQRFWGSLKLLEASEVRDWMGMYYGRPYWNVSAVKQCYRKIPGYNERAFDDGLGVMADYGDTGPCHTPINPSTIARALPTALALEKTVRRQLSVVEQFSATWPAKYQAWRNRAARLGQTDNHDFVIDLVDCLLTFHANTERTYFATIYHNSSVQSDFTTLLEKIDSATHGNTAVVHLIGGLAGVSHMAMQDSIVNLHGTAERDGFASDAWKDSLAEFLDEHGFHADAELDLTCPRWSEEPDRVRTMIESMLANENPPADPAASLVNQRKRFEMELAMVRQRVRSNPLTRLRFERALDKHVDRARDYLVARERMREFSSQAYAIVRAYVVEAGLRLTRDGRLSDPRDVFMLSVHELADLAQSRHGSGTLTRTIAFRRAMYEGYRDVTPPHELGGDTIPAPPVSGGLAGLGCSPGIAEGTARVIASLSDIGELRTGDILVTRFTDPGWTPALGLIAGVVTEVGGMLSHAAVIGREYGIPAVLNVTGATEAIQSGQRIRVNGSTGEISRLENQNPVPIAIAQCSATRSM